jgi:hypothetical protein
MGTGFVAQKMRWYGERKRFRIGACKMIVVQAFSTEEPMVCYQARYSRFQLRLHLLHIHKIFGSHSLTHPNLNLDYMKSSVVFHVANR